MAVPEPFGLRNARYRAGLCAHDDGGQGGKGLLVPIWPERVSFEVMEIDVQTVVFREGDHVVAQCLDVDVSSFGASEEEALASLREALELYFEDAPADALAKVEGPAVRRLTLQRA